MYIYIYIYSIYCSLLCNSSIFISLLVGEGSREVFWQPSLDFLSVISELPGGQSMTARCASDASAARETGGGAIGEAECGGVVLAGDWEDLR